MQISEKDVRIVKVLGRGASSVVSAPDMTPASSLQAHRRMHARRHPVVARRDWGPVAAQVYKAFLARCGKFVAIKKINCFERVRTHATVTGSICLVIKATACQSL